MPGPTPGVWFRKEDGWWYCSVKGQQRRLTKGKNTKTAAQDMLRELLGKPRPTVNSHRPVADILDAYLEFMEGPDADVSPGRLKMIQDTCESFAHKHGAKIVSELTPADAKEWLDENPTWSSGSRRTFLGVIRACFNWAQTDEVKLLSHQPLGKYHGGTFRRREFLASSADIDKLLTYPNPAYHDFVTALVSTGCRPSEVSRVEAADVNLQRRCWTLTRHKTQKKKPSPRVVWLDATMLKLTKRLMQNNPTGPLFRTSIGTKWTPVTVKAAFKVMRDRLKLPAELCAYSMRHEYITRSLSNGNDALTVANGCGTSVAMLQKNYAHLMQVPEHMLAAVERARRR